MEEAVAWYTVGSVVEDSKSIGTGAAILWRQRSLILTARHVIENSPNDDNWFYFRDEGTMKRAPIEELPADLRSGQQAAGVRILDPT